MFAHHAATFYYIKGILSLVATVLLIWHMSRTWDRINTWGQRLRYLTLLYFAVLVTYASAQQVREDAVVNARNVGALFGMGLLVVTAVVSIREDKTKTRKGRRGADD